MKKVLVTGGAGFVGSDVVRTLKDNHGVGVLDNFMRGYYPLLSYVKDIDVLNMDIRDERIKEVIKEYDCIVHLAAIAGNPACNIDKNFSYDVNVNGTKNIVKNLGEYQEIIFTSTSYVYGDVGVANEDSYIFPRDFYSMTKAIGEEIVSSHNRYIIFRPAVAFGVSKTTRLDTFINSMIYDALSSNNINVYNPYVTKTAIHVSIFARAIAYAVDDNMRWNNVYNLGDKYITMTKLDVANKIAKITGADVSVFESDEVNNFDIPIDTSKIEKEQFYCGTYFDVGTGVFEMRKIFPIVANNANDFTVYGCVKKYLKES